MKTTNNNFNENVNPVYNHSNAHGDGGRMTSIEIAELTGKQHKDLMKAIRNMEPAWEKVNGRKFALVEYRDKKGERRPCYSLTKEECLYIATKFNDEARARLVRRWMELELAEREREERVHELVAAHAAMLDAKCTMLTSLCDTLKPKAEFTDAVLCSEDTLTVTQMAQDYGVGAVRFNRLLEALHIQHRVGGQWVLFAPHQGRGYVHSYTTYHVSTKEGYIRTQLFTRWTQLGRQFLYERLRQEGIQPNTQEAPRKIVKILNRAH